MIHESVVVLAQTIAEAIKVAGIVIALGIVFHATITSTIRRL